MIVAHSGVSKAFNGYFEGIKDGKFLNRGLKNCEIKKYEDKVKKYKDDEFEIIDYKDGLRPEDFCFICQTKEGKPFSAKPTGDRKLKSWYLENIDKIIGEMGKVKYFEMSKENIPQQTIFQCIRYKEDIDE